MFLRLNDGQREGVNIAQSVIMEQISAAGGKDNATDKA